MAGPRRTIALVLPVRIPHIERTLQGIGDYARRRARWVFASTPEAFGSFEGLRGFRGDGVIALVNTPREERIVLRLGVPAVNLSGALRRSRLPRVTVDNAAIGRAAAGHLMACGFPRFAYYGLRGVWYAEERGRGFAGRLGERGLPCAVHEETRDPSGSWAFDPARLERWLASLRRPVGLLACSDQRARLVLEACARLRLRVPRDVGLLGVDNDELTCEFCRPTLSSVSRNAHALGVEAARLLDRLLRGGAPPAGDRLLPPGEVVRRASTDVDAVEHPELRRAVRLVRERLGEPFGVEALVREASVSRRTLETLFRRHLHCTPHRFIERARVERARALMGDGTRRSLKGVARASGFASSRRLNQAFRRVTGRMARAFCPRGPVQEAEGNAIASA
jgi:LacI family transcriptional regulator